jgi:excisionase family DNA binding protein
MPTNDDRLLQAIRAGRARVLLVADLADLDATLAARVLQEARLHWLEQPRQGAAGYPAQHDYTRKEAADQLRISVSHLDNLISRGALRSYKVGRMRRIRAADLEQFREEARRSWLDLRVTDPRRRAIHGPGREPGR